MDEKKSDGFFVGMLFIPGRAGPEQGLDDTEGVFGESGQFGPLWVDLNRRCECNAFRIGVSSEEVICYTESFIEFCARRRCEIKNESV